MIYTDCTLIYTDCTLIYTDCTLIYTDCTLIYTDCSLVIYFIGGITPLLSSMLLNVPLLLYRRHHTVVIFRATKCSVITLSSASHRCYLPCSRMLCCCFIVGITPLLSSMQPNALLLLYRRHRTFVIFHAAECSVIALSSASHRYYLPCSRMFCYYFIVGITPLLSSVELNAVLLLHSVEGFMRSVIIFSCNLVIGPAGCYWSGRLLFWVSGLSL